MKIKSQAEISKKWGDAIGRVPGAYKAGVAATTDWQEKAGSADAEALWKTKIDEAAARKARQKAIAATSNEEWRSAAVNKGAARIGAGMTAAQSKRAMKHEPYRAAIEGMTLPAKTSDPAQNVTNRVIPIAVGLSELKKSIA